MINQQNLKPPVTNMKTGKSENLIVGEFQYTFGRSNVCVCEYRSKCDGVNTAAAVCVFLKVRIWGVSVICGDLNSSFPPIWNLYVCTVCTMSASIQVCGCERTLTYFQSVCIVCGMWTLVCSHVWWVIVCVFTVGCFSLSPMLD